MPVEDIRIYGVSDRHVKLLHEAAERGGYRSLQKMLKQQILYIVSQPQKIVLPSIWEGPKDKEIRISGLTSQEVDMLETIADNMCFSTLNAFMRTKLYEIITNASERDRIKDE